jgi:regulator of sigma E protease
VDTGIIVASILEAGIYDVLQTVWHIAKIALGIGFVIFVHELGHFLAAKICGVKCEKFYVGFDVPIKIGPIQLPSKLIHFTYGETEYGVGLIPLGGYVKMLGQEDYPGNAAEEAERIRQETEGEDGETRVALDPRSYAAKTVPQRMLIISAGVIMNVIFAVLMAAVAYSIGVNYTTCLVGGTAPGDPAWTAGIQAGDWITKVGKDGKESDQLRYQYDLKTAVIGWGFGKENPDPLEFTVKRDGTPRNFSIAPNRHGKDAKGMVTIGVLFEHSMTIGDGLAGQFSAAEKVKSELAAGDRVTGVNGQELDKSLANGKGELPATEFRRRMLELAAEDITLNILRTKVDGSTENVDVVVPAQPRMWLGVEATMGPIVAIQAGSPAESAGLQVDDLLLSIQDQPVGEPTTVPRRLQDESTIKLTVQRKGIPDPISVEVEAVGHEQTFSIGTFVGWNRVGISYSVDPTISFVAAGSEAETAGVKVGDKIERYEIEPRSDKVVNGTELSPHKLAIKLLGRKYGEAADFDKDRSFATMSNLVQHLPPGLHVRMTLLREKKEIEAKLVPVPQEGAFYPERGIAFTSYTRVRTAESLSEAMSLGVRETKERLSEVWTILTHLVRGHISSKNLGGPIRIAQAASQESKQGIPRLLIFLTLLSANLAILNSLPFPVLDGGHFTFLLWEGIARRPVPERVQMAASMFGLIALLLLMAYVFFNDITSIFMQ